MVAVLGCGKRGSAKEGWAIGHAHAEGWLKADSEARLFGVDIVPENLAAFGEQFKLPPGQLFSSAEALYAAVKPDFVSVCTWPALHHAMVLDAVKHGVKGIVCEKPMALDVGQMRQMRDTCAAAGTRLAIAHQRRHEPLFQLARKLVQSGVIGDSWVLEARVGDDWDILSWTVHWFDMANFLLDAKPLRVLAGGDVTGERRYQHAVENASIIFAEYTGGHQAIFVTGPAGDGITIRGTKGMLQIDREVKVWNESGFATHKPDNTEFPGAWTRLMQEMLSKQPMLCDVSEAFIATEMAYAAHESMRTSRTITFPFTSEYAPLEVMSHRAKPVFPFKKIVVYADEHFGSGGREGLAEALESLGGKLPSVVDAVKELSSADLSDADLLVLYHTQKSPNGVTRNSLTAWVGANKPLILVHAALGAYPDWPEYGQWCGRVWDWSKSEHPHEPSVFAVCDAQMPTAWSEAWLPRDEVFIKLGDQSDVKDLMMAQIGTRTFPAAWISRDHPRIGVWVPGHRRDIWSLPVMREGLAALARRVAGSV
jgi:predicted dehydrogenase